MRRQKESFVGQKSSQTIDLFLLPWQEATGECVQVVASPIETTVLLKTAAKTFRLHLPLCNENLQDLAGKRIGILGTDIQGRKYAVRRMTPEVKGVASPETTTYSQSPRMPKE